MATHTDKTFINRLSPTLRNFKWKKGDLANCSCPICGDSQKNKSKARGFFYQKGNDFFYKCHNCSYGSNLYNFLKELNPSLCKEYQMQRWKDGESGHSNYKKPAEKEMFTFDRKPKPNKSNKYLKNCTPVSELPEDHFCVEFLNLRKIPKQHWKLLYFTDNFGKFMKRMDPEFRNVCGFEPRLVIPFYNKEGEVVAAQGRALTMKDENNARATVKYLTVKTDKSSDRLWYGQWRVDPKKTVYIVEGPLDSMFIPNTIAMVGAGALDQIPLHLSKSKGVYVLDNEPRNQQIVKYNERLIEMGKNVCIWPDTVYEKDINDIAMRISTREIRKIIDKNTFSGLEATLRLNEWRRV